MQRAGSVAVWICALSLRAPQIVMALSYDPDTIRVPSGEYDTEEIQPLWAPCFSTTSDRVVASVHGTCVPELSRCVVAVWAATAQTYATGWQCGGVDLRPLSARTPDPTADRDPRPLRSIPHAH